MRKAVYAAFFLSGATALIYEVLWVRVLSLSFGNTVYAVGVVLTAFMSGLTLGSWAFGRLSDKIQNHLKAYGVMEVLVALSALASPWALEKVSSAYLSLSPSHLALWEVTGLRYLLTMAVLLVPTTLMGGTLPVLSRYVITGSEEFKKGLGTLYSINTLGGVTGTFLVGFFMVRYLGVDASVLSTASVNMALGLGVYALGIRMGKTSLPCSGPLESAIPEPPAPTAPPVSPRLRAYALAAFAASGFAAMVYQVAWNRLLVGVLGSTTFAFSLILMGFLLGLALGSALATRLKGGPESALRGFAVAEALIGVTCLATLFIYQALPWVMQMVLVKTSHSYNSVLAVQFLLVLALIIVPTTLMGATFPLIATAYGGRREGHMGSDIGRIYAANTAGAIAGSALAAFALLPLLGTSATIRAAVVLNMLIAAGGFYLSGIRLTSALSVVLGLIVALAPLSIPSHLLDTGVAVYGYQKDFRLKRAYLFQKEGLNATVSVTVTGKGGRSLRTNGKTDASTSIDMGTQLSLGYLPGLLHNSPEKALVIGLGSGVTLRALGEIQGVQDITCVEIEGAMVEGSEYFKAVNRGILKDPRVKCVLDDARGYLAGSRERYDIIISEPSNPWISGIGSLYSQDFYRMAASRLKEDGLFCQWVELYGLSPEDLKMVMATFTSVFPNSHLWHPPVGDILLIGYKDKEALVNVRRIKEVYRTGAPTDLSAYLVANEPEDLLSYHLLGPEELAKLSLGAGLNTDDRPRLEFSAPFSLYTNAIRDNINMYIDLAGPPKSEGGRLSMPLAEYYYRKGMIDYHFGAKLSGKWITKALALQPQAPDTRMLAAALVSKQSQAKALRELSEYSAKGYPWADYFMAKIKHEIDPRGAKEHSEKALRTEPDNFIFLNLAAELDFKAGRYPEARQKYLRLLELPHTYEQNLIYIGALSTISLRLRDYGLARKYNLLLLEANPLSVETLNLLGDIELLLGQRDKGCDYYIRAYDLASDEETKPLLDKLSKYCGTGSAT